jgi:hypothetical protein
MWINLLKGTAIGRMTAETAGYCLTSGRHPERTPPLWMPELQPVPVKSPLPRKMKILRLTAQDDNLLFREPCDSSLRSE